MFDTLRKIVRGTAGIYENENRSSGSSKKIQIATCALFIEMGLADDDFTEQERIEINSLMKRLFNLTDDEAGELFSLSEDRVKQSVSIYEFTSLIDKNFTKDEKFELLKNLWRLVFIDEKLNAYEENLMRKIRLTLNMEHSDLIAAKLEVKKELNQG